MMFRGLLVIIVGLGFAPLLAAQEASVAARQLIILPNPDAPWGGEIPDVSKVLYSAAEPIWQQFPTLKLKPILVEPKGGPVVLYQPGPEGEIQVRLNTGDRLWAQHAFQFAHEFGHIVCRYRSGANRNKWFEESICELASLYSLRQMAKTWQTTPPYPNWKGYASALANYADERMKKATLSDTTFADWYRAHADELYRDAVQRDHNLIVATELLPLFEAEPVHWEAVGHLNDTQGAESRSFAEHLRAWHGSCPAKHRPFVQKVAAKFEIELAPVAQGK